MRVFRIPGILLLLILAVLVAAGSARHYLACVLLKDSCLPTLELSSIPPGSSTWVYENPSAGYKIYLPKSWSELSPTPEAYAHDELSHLKIFGPEARDAFPLLEIGVYQQSAAERVDAITTRLLKVKSRSNLLFKGSSSIRIDGDPYHSSAGARILLVPLKKRLYELRYYGESEEEFMTLLGSWDIKEEFSDTWGHLFEEAILFASERGIVKGYEDGRFRPDLEVNRAELAKMLVAARPEHSEAELKAWFDAYRSSGRQPFPDVPMDAWFSAYVYFSRESGWIQGYPDGFFRPGSSVNLVEALKMMLESSETRLSVPSSEEWFAPYARRVNDNGIMEFLTSDGASGLRFYGKTPVYRLHDKASRGMIAELIYRLITLQEHPELDRFAVPIPWDALGDGTFGFTFSFPAKDTLFARSPFLSDLYSSEAYGIFASRLSGELIHIEKLPLQESFKAQSETQARVFLSEDDEHAYYMRVPKCTGEDMCALQKIVSGDLSKSFAPLRNPPERYKNSSIPFEFLYDPREASFEFGGQAEHLSVEYFKRGSLLASVDLLKGQSLDGPVLSDAKPLVQDLNIGFYRWRVLVKNHQDLLFASRFGDSDLLVLRFPGVAELKGLSTPQQLLLKSIAESGR